MNKVLVIEDDDAIRSNILDLVEAEGFDGRGAANGNAGVAAALHFGPDVVICDITMAGLDGYGVLEALRRLPDTATVPFIFLTARAERADVRAGMNLGADDYLTKPFTRAELLDAIRARLVRRRAATTSPQAGAALPSHSSHSTPSPALRRSDTLPVLIVRSPVMRALYEEARRAARSNLSVLILGETGVGKEGMARAIHDASKRATGPFVPLNCAALSETLLESELFGHEKGSFTGAHSAQAGVFESADGGTIFLDEVADLVPAIQAKLLRVLEDRRVQRIGGRTPREVDLRFVTATNRDIGAAVHDGSFRRDLWFRINGVTLEIPPLRERRGEIAPLAEAFVIRASEALGLTAPLTLARESIAALEQHDWPGNVRELRNVMDRAVALCDGATILPAHLTTTVRDTHRGAPATTPGEQLRVDMADLEKERIVEVLEACDGNQTKAAAALGVSRRTLVSRLDEYRLPRPRPRRRPRETY